MGFLDNLQKNLQAKVDEKAMKQLEELLMEKEEVELLTAMNNDFSALTDKRLIFVDNTIFSNKKQVVSVPYSKITAVSINKDMWSSTEITVLLGSHKLELKSYDKGKIVEMYNAILKKLL